MRKIISTIVLLLLSILPAYSYGDFAKLVAEAVLVERDPVQPSPAVGSDPYAPVPASTPIGAATAINASYKTTGGWAIASKTYIDAAAMVFDFAATKSVSRATLNLPIQQIFPLGGSAHLRVYAFADNGVLDHTDYRIGFPTAIAYVDAAGMSTITLDVTGFVNATLKTSRFVGFRVVPAFNIGSIPDVTFPAYKGVKFNPAAYSLEFTAGAAPIPGPTVAAFDGLTMAVPNIYVSGLGMVYAQFQLQNINSGLFTLTNAVITEAHTVTPGGGLALLNCAAFGPPVSVSTLGSSTSTYVISSGLTSVGQLNYLGQSYAAKMQHSIGTQPMQFALKSFEPVVASGVAASVSVLGGGINIEPSQDFIPLCHGWVLIGDTATNRLVERNVISGETASSYPLNTIPDQMMLDEPNGLVHFTTHPEAQRLYKLNLASGVISSNNIIDASVNLRFSPRDIALGENGNIFAILYDRLKTVPNDPMALKADEGLWLGLLDTNAAPVIGSQPLASPLRIEYDRIFKRVFLANSSNLATFDYNTFTHVTTLYPGTDVPVGESCTDFVISPDGNRLAYSCPAGNNEAEIHLSIHDLNPVDYYNPYGEWYLGAAPLSAFFNTNGTLLIATDGVKLFIFDVVTHKRLAVYELGLPATEKVKQIRLSKDGGLILVFIKAGLNDASGRMYWMRMPAITGTPLPP